MIAVLRVAARDLRAALPAATAALVAALLPWLAPLLPGVARQPAADVREVTAVILAALLGVALAAFAGAGLAARDLAEGRMGFFLALPLRVRALWTGRLLAAAVLVYGGILAVVLPVAIAGRWPLEWRVLPDPRLVSTTVSAERWLPPLLLAGAPLLLLLVAHQLATALKSRSPWLLLDLATFAASGVALTTAAGRLRAANASIELTILVVAVFAAALVALAFAGAVGLRRGGVLLSRVHRAQALCAMLGLGATSLAALTAAHWVLDVDASDLRAVRGAVAAPVGPWIAVRGPLAHRPGYAPWMLVDGKQTVVLPAASGEPDAPLFFSADGRTAIWLESVGRARAWPSSVVWLDLGEEPRMTRGGPEVMSAWDSAAAVDGDRLALVDRERVTVWTEKGAKLLLAAELPRVAYVSWPALRWLDHDHARVVRIAAGADDEMRLQTWDADLATRRVRSTCDGPLAGDVPLVLTLSPDGMRLLISRGFAGRGGIVVVDAASGATIAELVPPEHGIFAVARWLADGRVVVAVGRQDRLTLELRDPHGASVRRVDGGPGAWGVLGDEWREDASTFAALVPSGKAPGGRRLLRTELREIDWARGTVHALGPGLAPAGGATPWGAGSEPAVPGQPATRLFLQGPTRSLVRLLPGGAPERVLPR
jgi:hypothetical protein